MVALHLRSKAKAIASAPPMGYLDCWILGDLPVRCLIAKDLALAMGQRYIRPFGKGYAAVMHYTEEKGLQPLVVPDPQPESFTQKDEKGNEREVEVMPPVFSPKHVYEGMAKREWRHFLTAPLSGRQKISMALYFVMVIGMLVGIVALVG